MKKIFETEFEAAKKSDDFNEDWEQALYRICYGRPRMKPRVSDISKFFSYIKDELLSDQQEIIGETLARLLTQTSVTSVTSTDQGQPPVLPEREGAYKRRYLDNFDHWILDKKTNEKISDESAALLETIYTDLKEQFPDADFKFAGWMTVYASKHKFFGIAPNNKYRSGAGGSVLKHQKNNYRIAKIGGIPTTMAYPFTLGKHHSARGEKEYSFFIPDIASYNTDKDLIFKVINDSNEMATAYWKNTLKIDYKEGNFRANEVAISNDFSKVEELCQEYLDPDYTYDV
jgi:hypothetical protein